MTLKALTAAVAMALVMGCTPDVDEPVDAAEVAYPATVPDPVDPIDAEEPAFGPDNAVGSSTVALGEWDTNNDNMLDAAEFRAGFTSDEWFTDWDDDDDGMISESEFEAIHAGWGDAPGGVDMNGLFDLWDADEDGLIDNDELEEGIYANWDRDHNGMIDDNEFTAGNDWFL